nr:MAG TPA: hypothetical protein [Caudoviricetes sp.]
MQKAWSLSETKQDSVSSHRGRGGHYPYTIYAGKRGKALTHKVANSKG